MRRVQTGKGREIGTGRGKEREREIKREREVEREREREAKRERGKREKGRETALCPAKPHTASLVHSCRTLKLLSDYADYRLYTVL